MYKILIVDDEELIRQDLVYRVGASGYSFEWIMDVSSGEEALEIIRTTPPDILFTDIMMFETSGLDLIEKARSFRSKLVSAIICGYPDFSFAQRALKLGVVDYLLKPVSPEQLNDVLAKTTSEVERQRCMKKKDRDNYVFQMRLSNQRGQELFDALCTGQKGVDFDELVAGFPDGVSHFRFMLFRLGYSEDTPQRERLALRYGVHNILHELCPECISTGNSSNPREVVAIWGIFGEDERRDLAEAEKLRVTLEKGLLIRIDLGLSERVDSLDSSIYIEARDALDLRFSTSLAQDSSKCDPLDRDEASQAWHGKTWCYKNGDDTYSWEKDAEFYEIHITMFKSLLSAGDINNAASVAVELLKSYQTKKKFGIRAAYTQLIVLLSRSCYRKGVHILPLLGSENINGSVLDDCEDFEELSQRLYNLIITAMSSWICGQNDIKWIMNQVRSYIEGHYCESSLCTKELANRFSISLGYLSASYRKVFGITISKYIITKRVSYAASLLRETQLSIQSVSENSGFNNLSYFMRVFKSYYGMTPGQFRENVKSTGGFT